ncbi:hypothetical protein ISCGN_030027 [Ixodes scapularis]
MFKSYSRLVEGGSTKRLAGRAGGVDNRVSLCPDTLNRRLSAATAGLRPTSGAASPAEDNTPSGSYSSFDAVVRDRILADKKTEVNLIGEPVVTFQKKGDHAGIELDAKDTLAELRVGDEAPVLERDLILAGALVRDAMDSYHSDFQMTERAVRIYTMYHHWALQLLLYVFIMVHHLLAVFERPAVSGWELPIWATMLVESCCLAFYTFRLVQAASFSRAEVFWKDAKNLVVMVVVGATIVDMVIFAAMAGSGFGMLALRCTRPLRPLLMVNFAENKQVRRAVRNIRNTLKEIVYALILLFMSIALFSLLALKLFQRSRPAVLLLPRSPSACLIFVVFASGAPVKAAGLTHHFRLWLVDGVRKMA